MTKKQKITAVLALAFAFSLRRRCSCRTEDRPARRRRQDHTSTGRNAQGSLPAFLRGSAGKTCGAFSQRRGRRSFRVKMKPGWEFASGRAFRFSRNGQYPTPLFAHKGLSGGEQLFWRSGACDPVPRSRNTPRNIANKGEFMSRSMRAMPQYFFCIISPDIAPPYLHNSFFMLSGETVITPPRQHHLFLLQMQIPQNQRNKAIFIIAVSFASHWLLTYFMALYAL